MSWLLLDYGEVLSLPQPAEERRLLEEEAECSGADFWTAYWRYRADYDRGELVAREYWSSVLGRKPTPRQLDQLIERDVAGWLHPNPASLAAATRAAQRGLQLAILSNAPEEVAAAVDGAIWSAAFAPRLFSCRLRINKPEPGIYSAALGALDASPDEVIFFDDRLENVASARRAGIRAEHFVGPAQIDEIAAE